MSRQPVGPEGHLPEPLEPRRLLAAFAPEAPAFASVFPVTQVITAELNGDGRDDLAIGQSSSGQTLTDRISLRFTTPAGLRGTQGIVTLLSPASRFTAGRLSTSDTSIYLATASPDGTVTLLRATSNGSANPTTRLNINTVLAGTGVGTVQRNIVDLAIGDFTRDGVADLLILTTAGGSSFFTVVPIDQATGRFGRAQNTELPTNATTLAVWSGRGVRDDFFRVVVGFGTPTTRFAVIARPTGGGPASVRFVDNDLLGSPRVLAIGREPAALLENTAAPAGTLVLAAALDVNNTTATRLAFWQLRPGGAIVRVAAPSTLAGQFDGSVTQILVGPVGSTVSDAPGITLAFTTGAASTYVGSTAAEPLRFSTDPGRRTLFVADLNNDLTADLGAFRRTVRDISVLGATARPATPLLTTLPAAATTGQTVTLTAFNMRTTINAAAVRVQFFRDADRNGVFNPSIDVLIGEDTRASDGFSISRVRRPAWGAGTVTLFARGFDARGGATPIATAALPRVSVTTPG
jgi:hypothetical protein